MREPLSPRRLLLPLVPAYRLGLWLRELRLGSRLEPVRRLSCPVVSVGNLSTGGAGKTPLTITLAKALKQRGFDVDVLSRGYGRRSRVAARVDPAGTAGEFGDEPLLIAQEAGVPVYVARQRYEAGLLAEGDRLPPTGRRGLPLVHLLDDGFQHRQLGRDIDILLLNGRDWKDGVLPAGNLREPLKAIGRAGVIAIPANENELEAELRNRGWRGPVWRLRRSMGVPAIDGPVVAFCGIARPEQFFDGLEGAGLQLSARIAFPDHHRYRGADLERLRGTASGGGAVALMTTEKDRARLGELAAGFPASLPLRTARLGIEIENQDAAIDWLAGRIASGPATAHL